MQLLFAIAVVLGLYFLFFAGEDRWSGYVYPDANNLSVHRSIGDYPTLEECRAAALGTIRAGGWQNADYECGLNCEPHSHMGINVCEKTEN